jgi:hypothetical protein
MSFRGASLLTRCHQTSVRASQVARLCGALHLSLGQAKGDSMDKRGLCLCLNLSWSFTLTLWRRICCPSLYQCTAVYTLVSLVGAHTGVTCGSKSGTATYASVISISIKGLEFSGTLPSEIGSFGSLSSLDGRNNGIRWINTVQYMYFINMYYNALTGSIPASVGSLVALQVLNLNSNALTGSIP